MYSSEPESDTGKQALEMCLKTLKYMAKGGINDHISKVSL